MSTKKRPTIRQTTEDEYDYEEDASLRAAEAAVAEIEARQLPPKHTANPYDYEEEASLRALEKTVAVSKAKSKAALRARRKKPGS